MRNFNVDERRRWSAVSAFADGLDLVLKKVSEVGCTASGFGLTATITAEDGGQVALTVSGRICIAVLFSLLFRVKWFICIRRLFLVTVH